MRLWNRALIDNLIVYLSCLPVVGEVWKELLTLKGRVGVRVRVRSPAKAPILTPYGQYNHTQTYRAVRNAFHSCEMKKRGFVLQGGCITVNTLI